MPYVGLLIEIKPRKSDAEFCSVKRDLDKDACTPVQGKMYNELKKIHTKNEDKNSHIQTDR